MLDCGRGRAFISRVARSSEVAKQQHFMRMSSELRGLFDSNHIKQRALSGEAVSVLVEAELIVNSRNDATRAMKRASTLQA